MKFFPDEIIIHNGMGHLQLEVPVSAGFHSVRLAKILAGGFSGFIGALVRYLNEQAPDEQLEDLMDTAILECERFYPALQMVLWAGPWIIGIAAAECRGAME